MKSGRITVDVLLIILVAVCPAAASPAAGADLPAEAAVRAVDRQQIESEWLDQHRREREGQSGAVDAAAVEAVVKRAVLLAKQLRTQGAEVGPYVERLEQLRREVRAAAAAAERYRHWFFQAHWVARELAFRNPLLDFDRLLFVRRAPGSYAYMADQYYGWFSRPGGGLYVLEGLHELGMTSVAAPTTPAANPPSGRPRLRLLTGALPPGSVLRADLSYDATRVLFAWCRHYSELAARPDKLDKAAIPEDAFYHLYEVRLDGSGLRKLTAGKYDDFDGRYLPDGRIVFVSTRRGRFVQTTDASAQRTCRHDLPDSYMRCGGSLQRPVPACTLHTIDADGSNLRAISASEGFEWNPSVADDGRIVYSRWDYVDRDSLPFISLWSTLPDGSDARAVFGNFTKNPLAMFEARCVPGSRRLVFTAAAQHSITGGSLVLLDPRSGPDEPAAMTRLTPDVPWPESEAWPDSYYAAPYPLSEDFYLVSWSNRPLVSEQQQVASHTNPENALGLYLLDRFGNRELLHRDRQLSSMDAIPVRPRPRPPGVAAAPRYSQEAEGRMLLLDVYRGLEGVARGSVRRLRIVGVPPKTQPVMNFPVMGLTEEDAGKFVLGTVPVESDGSAQFRVPAGVPFFLQALDDRGMAVQTMRSTTYVQPGQRVTCIGCHELRTMAPPNQRALAAGREAQRIEPGPEGSWPFDYDRLVQPVLDRQCLPCHAPGYEGGQFNLAPGYSYSTLISYGQRGTLQSHVLLRYSIGSSLPNTGGARANALVRYLRRDHYNVQLPSDHWERLTTWMDLYGQRTGSFSREQERELTQLRQHWAPLLAEPEPE